jgi:hypothetical protein
MIATVDTSASGRSRNADAGAGPAGGLGLGASAGGSFLKVDNFLTNGLSRYSLFVPDGVDATEPRPSSRLAA